YMERAPKTIKAEGCPFYQFADNAHYRIPTDINSTYFIIIAGFIDSKYHYTKLYYRCTFEHSEWHDFICCANNTIEFYRLTLYFHMAVFYGLPRGNNI